MKQFYTERDIEDLVRNGQSTLRMGSDVVLTDLAYEKARLLGLQLISSAAESPASTPARSVQTSTVASSNGNAAAKPRPASSDNSADLAQRIRSAVKARLGDQIDAQLLDSIIQRVVRVTGVK